MEDLSNGHNTKTQIVKCTDRISAPQQDTKWSWFVCFAGLVCNVITCGFAYSYGILFPNLLDEFQEGKAKTAWVGSLAMLGHGLYGPLAGKLYHRFGPRFVTITGAIICMASLIATSAVPNINLMFLTYSIPFGIGASFIYMSVYLIVPRYFLKRRSLSLGLIAVGPGGGLFIVSPITQALFDRLGWRAAFLALTGIFFLICFLAFTFRPIQLETDEVDSKLDQTVNFLHFSIFRNKAFVIYTTAAAVYYLGHYTPSVHMVRYWEELGFPEQKAARLYLFSGVSSLVIRPVIGRLHDVRWINPCYMYIAAAATEGVATLLLPLATTTSHFVVFFVVYGFADGTVGSGTSIAVLNILPERQRPLGFGVYLSITSVLSACGPALGGFVADIEGSYTPVFYMVGTLALVGAIMMLPLRCLNNPDELSPTYDSTVLGSLIVVEKCSVV